MAPRRSVILFDDVICADEHGGGMNNQHTRTDEEGDGIWIQNVVRK